VTVQLKGFGVIVRSGICDSVIGYDSIAFATGCICSCYWVFPSLPSQSLDSVVLDCPQSCLCSFNWVLL